MVFDAEAAANVLWPSGSPLATRLENGLQILVVECPQAPIVSTALCYRAGSGCEPAHLSGLAHFLEHMMFKGSRQYSAGEIDRRTQALGGSSNAFTSHDSTLYYFSFATDRWVEALDIEVDRMKGLVFDSAETERERSVILEEIAEVEGDPWDALELAVRQQLFGDHAYGRSILGSTATLKQIEVSDLKAYHQSFYQPANAVLVVAGDIGEEALSLAAARFNSLPGRPKDRCGPASPPTTPFWPRGLSRVERNRGAVSRMLLALPAPPTANPDHAVLRLLAAIAAGSRSSRLYRRLVDEEQLCISVSAEVSEGVDAGAVFVALELLPESEPRLVERIVVDELVDLTRNEPSAGELERAKRLLVTDWILGHESIHNRALTVAVAAALFDLEFPRRHLGELLECDAARLRSVAARYLEPRRSGVLGWSLPEPDFRGRPQE